MTRESKNEVDQFVEFTLFLDSIENLESSLKFPLQFNVSVEFNDNVLNVEDVIVTVVDATGTIDLEVALNFPKDEISEYDNFASNPMLIYFVSRNGIEKRSQRSQRSTINNNGIKQTWVCVVDLLSLVYDNESWNSKGTRAGDTGPNKVGGQYPLRANGELNRNTLSDTVARLNATVSRPNVAGLFRTLRPNNVLNVTVHGLYNPPSGRGHRRQRHAATTCEAMLHVPAAAVHLRDLHRSVFARGTYTDVTRDVNDLRWYSLDNKPATVSATGQRYEEYDGAVVNSAKIPKPEDVLFQAPRFEWNLWRRFVLYETSSLAFQEAIFKHGCMLVIFKFTENQAIATNRHLSNSSGDVVGEIPLHVAFLDLSMLLQPDCTSIRCLSAVHALDVGIMKNDEFHMAKFDIGEFNRKNIEGARSLKSTTPSLVSSHNAPTQAATESFAVVDITVTNSFHDQYLKHLTTRLLELNIIPNELPRSITCISPTSNKYRECLKNTIETLMKDSERLGDQSYMNELKMSEAHESMKSSLLAEIQLYIKDHYEKGLLIGETIQSFVNRIFTDLASEMKKTVEAFEFPHSGDADNVKSPRDDDDAVVYAREADELRRTERAKTFYLDLISNTAGARCNPNYWLLYASFCSRRLDFDTALECVKEVLLVDGGNRIGLFLYAAIQMTVHEDNNNGEIVLKSLVMRHGDFSEAYALLSVHYSVLEEDKASYIVMLKRAEESVKKDTVEMSTLISDHLMCWQPIGHNNNPLIKCVILLLELELVELAIRCLHLVKYRRELYNYYMAVCEYKKGNHLASLEHLKSEKLTGKYRKITDALKCLNVLDLNESHDILENDWLYVVHTEVPHKELHLVYLKAALHCYTTKLYAKGVEICQIAISVQRTPMILVLLAKCLIEIGDVKTAESALSEANVMDVKNEEVWAYLTVVNIKMGNDDEAKVCYTRALECGLKPDIKNEIDTYLGKEH